jgi:phosphoglycolate phosphatase-like HAD superfamily hydrolase
MISARPFETASRVVNHVVGDRLGDLELAWSVGATGVLVKSGYGLGELAYHAPAWPRQPDLVADHLLEAVSRIVARGEAQDLASPPA